MSYSIPVYSQQWEKIKTVTLDASVFNDEVVNHSLIHDYIRMRQNNSRLVIAHTKNRWEVSWSGKKIYSQKGHGTGRAWEKRSPLRKKWWVAFWPRSERNFSISMNKKAKSKAMAALLTLKVKDNEVTGLDALFLKQIKTKDATAVLQGLKLYKSILLVIPVNDETITKSFRNIPGVKYLIADHINPYDLLTHKNVIITEEALQRVTERLR